MHVRPLFFSTALLLAAAAPWPALAQDGAPAALIASCEGCHGASGQTRSPETPRLNGQTREYLTARLQNLRIASSQTINAIHNMMDPVRSIPGTALDAVVTHFAAQSPAQPNHFGADHDRGAILYAKGRVTEIPACASCHGDRGQGVGEAARLAGQHSAYLQNQLQAMMISARVQGAMNNHVWMLTQDEVRELAAYLGND
jgi:cytochrome c553